MTLERVPPPTKPPAHHPRYNLEEDDLSIVYPDSDGEPMAENDHQLAVMLEAISALRIWYDDREDVYPGGDMLMYYRMNDNETRVAPDVFVVFGVESRHMRDSWIVWREGKAPDIVMELASGSTRRRDMREKRDIYAEMGVTEYWRFDPTSNYFFPPLIGESLEDGQYSPIELTTGSDGILRGHSAVMELDVCVLADGNLRFHDPVSGYWLRTPSEEAAARRASEATLREAETALSEEAAARQEEAVARREAETALSEESAARQATEAMLQASEAAREAAERELQMMREQLQRYQSEDSGESG